MKRNAERNIENFYESPSLPKINADVRMLHGDLVSLAGLCVNSPGTLQYDNEAIGIVAKGCGSIAHIGQKYGFDENDILLMEKGVAYEIKPAGETGIFTMTGNGIVENEGVIRSADKQLVAGIAGGTRKTLKEWSRMDMLDIHLIWVNKDNVKIPHYHNRFSELYLIQSGAGRIYLQDLDDYQNRGLHYEFEADVGAGDTLLVPSGIIHNSTGDMIAQVVGIPYFFPGDIKFAK